MPISAEEIGSVSFDPDLNEAVSVCAQVLGSLFSLDPITNEGDALVNEIAHLDCMREWPLGEPSALEQAQELIHAGSQNRPELVNSFISMHLAPWFPRYLELLEESSQQAFWQGVAILARTTLEAVIHELGIDIEQRKLYH